MNAIKTLRAALLQHILFFRFEQTFGKDWWETVLLPHMRQEAMDVNPSPAGKTYFAALKRFGRDICPESRLQGSNIRKEPCCGRRVYGLEQKGLPYRQLHTLAHRN